MRVAETRGALAKGLKGVPGGEIGFVPTMGALHEGHLSLVRQARQAGGAVVVSVFVNPTQFNDPADLKSYPRTPEKDLAMLEAEGVDLVFMPPVKEIYPEPDTRVWDFGELDRVMEGATRPGHFRGVAQVVSRLFDLVRPRAAYFGQKDYQQVAVIREMVRQAAEKGEPWAGVEIVECPTVREEDGLAMSSRNALLSAAHRAAAPDIYRALRLGALKAGELSWREVERYVRAEVERSGLLKTIYFEKMGPQACIAVQAGSVRLIDNMRYDY
jgi:pantoate--beta-alanine ligase